MDEGPAAGEDLKTAPAATSNHLPMPRSFSSGAASPRLAASLAVVVLGLGGCGGSSEAPPVQAERPLLVETAVAGTRDIEVTLDAVGTAYASGQVDIRPQVSGTLLTAPFVEGDHVDAGQVLAELDASKPKASLALAQAKLDSARARLAVATERLGRYRSLAAEDLVSREEYATLESEQKAAAAAVREHEAEVRLAERNLEDYTLRAPISGRIGIRYVDTGNFIESGTVLATLVEADPIEVLFTVPSAQMQGIVVGMDAEIRGTDAARTVLAKGRVRVIDPRVNVETRMVNVKALVPNPDDKVKPGQFVGVTLVRERRQDAVVVPEDAVIPYSGKTWVYVVEDGIATRREVTLGQRLPAYVEIPTGLAAGETIVTRGQHRLTDGAKVEPSTPAEPPAAQG